jgi:hypothetical protein
MITATLGVRNIGGIHMTEDEYKKLIYELIDSISDLAILKKICLFIHSIKG